MREPDAAFADPRQAVLYDELDDERSDLDAYLAIAEEVGAHRVVDIGCGTGSLAVRLAATGFEVVGVDPAAASLDVARQKPHADSVTWIHDDAASLAGLEPAADLAVMTGNVAQVFVTDEDWIDTLAAIRAILRPGGWLVFETRRPEARDWENWDVSPTAVPLSGERIAIVSRTVTDVALPLVTFESSTEIGGEDLRSSSTLRFREREEIESDLIRCGFQLVDLREAPDRAGKEMVFLARVPGEYGVLSVDSVVDRLGQTFAVFDARTQDSGHISYGIVDDTGRRSFVKTAGHAGGSPGGTSYGQRVAMLRRAARAQDGLSHPALVPVEDVIDASDGVLVVYRWFDGELLRSPGERRDDPEEAHARFRALLLPELAGALDIVIDLHVALESHGWIAGDFYDGCLMYDFGKRQIKVIDLESYRRGAYVNDVGRLPGSTRFMAPEEHSRGAMITAQTTVFNLGRMLEIFLLGKARTPDLQATIARATTADPTLRQRSVAALQAEWRSALPALRGAVGRDPG